jgi:hypothetical protein
MPARPRKTKPFSASSRERPFADESGTVREASPMTRRPWEANSSALMRKVFTMSSVSGRAVSRLLRGPVSRRRMRQGYAQPKVRFSKSRQK